MYNNYNPNYSYQNNTYGTPNYMQRPYSPQPQQMMQQTPPQQMQPQPQVNLPQIQDIRYATEEEAKAFIVFPNASAYFIDLPKNRLYVKSANSSGISNIDYFSLNAINPDGTPIKEQEQTPSINLDSFIKKEDIESLGFVKVSQYNELSQRLDQIQKRLEGIRNNGGNNK